MDEVLSVLQQSEQLGSEIIAKRAEMVAFDRRRNKNREALRAMSKLPNKDKEKVWLCSGNMFVKTTVPSARDIVEKDQSNITQVIDTLRNEVKNTTEKLQAMEGKDISRFDLKSISPAEAVALRDLLPKTM